MHFTKSGLYLFYDGATTRFDEKVGQVVAKRDAHQFPLPAYAVVLVTTENGRGLATTAAHIHIPDSYMTFEPWAIVVNVGEEITFTNNDMDLHVVMPSPEPMIMPEAGAQARSALWLANMQSFSPITLKGRGGKGVLTLSEPGLHHYYCPIHAAYDSTAYTYAPLKTFGGYPFIMDGVIVVLPT
ncbi:MAG: plastocyanin/azurin family copper-binding protein [Betaproteobacteria bacterium]|nr:plastocyanin/azurin family copper-binding protein [Betaproteobacteria bacterium]